MSSFSSSFSSSSGMSPPPPSIVLTGAANYLQWAAAFQVTVAAAGLTAFLTEFADPAKGRSATVLSKPSPPGGDKLDELKLYVAQVEAYNASLKVAGVPWEQRAAIVRSWILRWVSPEIGSTLSLTDAPALILQELKATYGRPASKSFYGIQQQLQDVTPQTHPNPNLMFTKMKSLAKELAAGGNAFEVTPAALCRMFYDKMQANPQFSMVREIYRSRADTGKLVDTEFVAFLDSVQSSYEEHLSNGDPPATKGLYAGKTGGAGGEKPTGLPSRTGDENNVHAQTTCQQCKVVGHTKANCKLFRAHCKTTNRWRFEGGTCPMDQKETFLKKLHALYTEFSVQHVPGWGLPIPPQRGTYRRGSPPGATSGMYTEVQDDHDHDTSEDYDDAHYAGGYVAQVVPDTVPAVPTTARAPASESYVFRGFEDTECSTPYFFDSASASSGPPVGNPLALPLAPPPSYSTAVNAALPAEIFEDDVDLPISGGTLLFPSTHTMWAVLYHWLPTLVMLCVVTYAGVPSVHH